jgi:hypothetical protein
VNLGFVDQAGGRPALRAPTEAISHDGRALGDTRTAVVIGTIDARAGQVNDYVRPGIKERGIDNE